MSLTQDCIAGVRHEGTPEGTLEKLGGTETYVAIPKDLDYPKEKAVLFLTDVFGIALVNNKLLCDDFARNGFQVYAPDFFDGDYLPTDGMNNPDFDVEAWRARHPYEKVRPRLDAVVAELKKRGITVFGATGYCFGAKYAIDLAKENVIASAVIAHPSRIAVPDDFTYMLAHSHASLLINSCEVDQAFPQESQAKADEIFGEGKYAPGYQRLHWEGCRHGFAVRGDMSDPKVKAGKEGAFKATVEWFAEKM